jgi:hypothetical protein
MKALLFFVFFSIIQTTSFADEQTDKIPPEIRPFAEEGTIIYDWKSADLNGDGLDDYLIVLEKQKNKPDDPYITEKERPLLIIIRQKDNTLKILKRNDLAVACSTCGGRVGDDGFTKITASKGKFSIRNHIMGTAYQTSDTYNFGYSRRDNTWQLISVDESTHGLYEDERDSIKNKFTPPHSFGKIDFSDFDPNDYSQRGEGFVLRKRKIE